MEYKKFVDIVCSIEESSDLAPIYGYVTSNITTLPQLYAKNNLKDGLSDSEIVGIMRCQIFAEFLNMQKNIQKSEIFFKLFSNDDEEQTTHNVGEKRKKRNN